MKKRSFYIKAAVSALFFVFVFKFVGTHDLIGACSNIDIAFLLAALAMSPLIILVTTLRWKILLSAQKTPQSFWFLMKTYYVGYYFSNLLPSNFGGDIVRSIYLGRRIRSQSLAAVSVLAERIVGLVVLLVLAVVVPCFAGDLRFHPALLVPAVLSVAGLIAIACVLRFTRPVSLVFRLLTSVVRLASRSGTGAGTADNRGDAPSGAGLLARADAVIRRLRSKADKFHDEWEAAWAYMRNKPGIVVALFLLTMAHYAMMWFNVLLCFKAFGESPPPESVVLALPSAMIVAMIPITLGSLGIAESSYVFYFGLVGIGSASTLAMGLLLRVKMILSGLIGLCFYATHRDAPIRDIEQTDPAA